MSDFFRDLKYGARALAARPAFALAVVATLALGVGITTAVFTAVSAVVLQPLPFAHADRLVTLCEQYPGSTADWCSISPPNVRDIAARAHSLESIGIGRTWSYSLATRDGQRTVNAALVTPGALTALGARPFMGRLIQSGDLIGRPSTITVLSYESWKTLFGGDPAIIGRTLVLDSLPVTVVGVMEPNFVLPRFPAVDLWRPIHVAVDDPDIRTWRGFVAYGRLRDGATMDQLRRDIANVSADLRRQYFATTERWTIVPQSLHDLVVSQVRPTMFALLGAAVALLLIGCVNIANLLLVRANARGREIAIRAALGATRARLARVLGIESALLGSAGSIFGIAFAAAFTKLFTTLAPAGIPRIESVHVDAGLIGVGALAGAVATLLFGTLPVFRAARGDLANALREGGRLASRRGGGLRSGLVVVQLAMAVALVAIAGLLVRTFAAYSRWDAGFDRSRLLVFSLTAPTAPGGDDRLIALWNRVERELGSLPGVESVATASAGPLFGGDGAASITIDGGRTPPGASVVWSDVSPRWFHTLGVPIVQGRDLANSDSRSSVRVTLVNEAFVRRYVPNQNAIGTRFTMEDRHLSYEIVGVVRDVASFTPGEPTEPAVYWSNRQLPRPFTYVLVRTKGAPQSVAGDVRARLATIDRDLEPTRMRPYMDIVSQNLARPRFTMLLIATFGSAALVLGGIGIYGLLAYVVSMRAREIAIRLALGAQRREVVGVVVAWGARLTGLGAVIGLVAAFVVSRLVASLVAGISPHDPLTFAGSAAVLVAVAIAASAMPARRASRVDPVTALTAE